HVFPARIGNSTGVLRIAHPGTVVLQTTVNTVRIAVVETHMVKLRNREVFGSPPFTTAIVRVPHPAVVADENRLCVCGIDPHIVRIAVRSLEPSYGRKTFAAVLADNQCPIGLE